VTAIAYEGEVTYKAVAFGLPYIPLEELL